MHMFRWIIAGLLLGTMTVRAQDDPNPAYVVDGIEGASVVMVRWSQSGDRFLIATRTDTASTIHVIDANTGDTILTILMPDPLNTSTAQSVEWAARDSAIVYYQHNGPVWVWDAATGEPVFSLAYVLASDVDDPATVAPELLIDSPDSFTRVALSPDGRMLAVETDYETQLWDIRTGEYLFTTEYAGSMHWSADGEWLQLGPGIWRIEDGDISPEPTLVMAGVQNAEGDNLAICGRHWNAAATQVIGYACPYTYDTRIFVWDAATGAIVLEITHTDDTFSFFEGAEWSADESLIVTWTESGGTKFWDAADGAPVYAIDDVPVSSVVDLQWHPDRPEVLVTMWNLLAYRVDPWAGELALAIDIPAPLEDLREGVEGAWWNADGTRILTDGFSDGPARLWDVDTTALIATFSGYTSVQPDPTGMRFAAWGADVPFGVWDFDAVD